jgi:Ca2+-binding RTX toxin-like protein
MFELLESRRLMSVSAFQVGYDAGGEPVEPLTIQGTMSADVILVRHANAGMFSVQVNGATAYYSSVQYPFVQIEGRGGDDLIDCNDDALHQQFLVHGGNGHDTIHGGPRGDTLFGGNGMSPELGGSHTHTNFLAERDSDDIDGHGGSDLVSAAWHSNGSVLHGGDGDDTLLGGLGDDFLYSDAGSSDIRAYSGDDTIYGGPETDWILAGAGDDTIYGGDGDDHIKGSNGNDTIYGGNGNDELTGGEGVDTIFGEAGNDHLTGDGDGWSNVFVDILDGGEGYDTVIF